MNITEPSTSETCIMIYTYISAQEWRDYGKGCYVRVQNLAWNPHRHG